VRASASCDVLLSTNSYLTAWATTIPTVVVVCDMVAFHPELLPQRRAALIERATLPLAVRRARTLAAISQATADDLIALQPAAAGKTVVTELAADARFATGGAPDAEVLARHGLTGRSYVLGVGTLEPRKNLPRLIEAFAALPDALRAEHELVLVGALGWDTDETLQAVERHRGLVRTLGHVPADDLPALYRGAAVFAYPSLYEGFGLPVLEAMTAGAPVLTSGVSSLPEVGRGRRGVRRPARRALHPGRPGGPARGPAATGRAVGGRGGARLPLLVGPVRGPDARGVRVGRVVAHAAAIDAPSRPLDVRGPAVDGRPTAGAP
jgi:hypothetical protein